MKDFVRKDNLVFILWGAIAGIYLGSAILGVSLLKYRTENVQSYKLKQAASHSGLLNKLEGFFFPSKQKKTVITNDFLELTIDPSKSIRSISPYIYGSNLTAKTEFEMDVAKFAAQVGVTTFRFPGSSSEGYHWQKGMFDYNDRFASAPLSKLENVIKFCEISQSKLILQVNIESGTPQEAAEWVRYMNITRNTRVDYWELGNEVYGDWERNYMPPEDYAKIVKEYSQAMKAVDPMIKIGANFGGPNFPFFDETMIKLAADYFDFVSYHWYPNHTNKEHADENGIHPHPETIMANSLAVKMMIDRIDGYIEKHAPQRKGKIEVAFLEWDGSWDAAASDLNYSYQGIMWSLANAIFYADTLGQFALLGIPVANQYNFQEVMFGLIRGWDKDAGWGGDRWDGETIRPKALALKLFAKHFGNVLIESQLKGSPVYYKGRDWRSDSYIGDVPYVTAYASKDTSQNRLAIALINKHASHEFSIRLNVKEALLEAQGKAWILNGPSLESQNDGHPGQVDIKQFDVSGIAPEFYVKLPAHSIMMLEIPLKQAQ